MLTAEAFRRRATVLLLLVAACMFSLAAQGPQTPSCGTFAVRHDTAVDNRLFPKGTYRVHAIGISCEKVMGQYGLFDQFLSQEPGAPLPKPWKSLIGAVGAPKFAAAPGVGFRVQRISDQTAPPTPK